MARRIAGPGPGKYALPALTGYDKHDPTRYRNPQFSFQQKTSLVGAPKGGDFVDTRGMTQHGLNTSPAYSIVERPKPLTTFRTPGPADYQTEKVRTGPLPPAYTHIFRPKGIPTFNTPGPFYYEKPRRRPNPAYTMIFKHTLAGHMRSPGPAEYDPTKLCTYKHCAPCYSIQQKPTGITIKTVTPGPGAYNLRERQPGDKCVKGLSMGSRVITEPYIVPEDELPCINK